MRKETGDKKKKVMTFGKVWYFLFHFITISAIGKEQLYRMHRRNKVESFLKILFFAKDRNICIVVRHYFVSDHNWTSA